MMNIKNKGWSGPKADEEPAEELVLDGGAEEDEAADAADLYAPDGPQSEAYADFLRRAMEDHEAEMARAAGEPAEAAPFDVPADPATVAEEPRAAGKPSFMLRCAHAAAHPLMVAAIFWVVFGSTSSTWIDGSEYGSYSLQLTNMLSYLTSYTLVIALLGLPGILMAASLPAGARSKRLASAACACDLLVAMALLGLGAAFGYSFALGLGVVYLAAAGLAAAGVLKG